jgi:hypothetical protein
MTDDKLRRLRKQYKRAVRKGRPAKAHRLKREIRELQQG